MNYARRNPHVHGICKWKLQMEFANEICMIESVHGTCIIESAQENLHDGIRSRESAWWNLLKGICSIESAQWICLMEFAPWCSRESAWWNLLDGICSMESARWNLLIRICSLESAWWNLLDGIQTALMAVTTALTATIAMTVTTL